MIILNKIKLITILASGIVIILVLTASNFNIEVTINGKEKSSSGSQSVQGVQTDMHDGDSMASHHGGSVTTDATVFNSLIGKPAPDFTLETYDGNEIALSSLKGKNVILFFNEGLMCYPACWNQIAAFGKDTELGKKVVVLNITTDPKNNWKQAIDKMPELAEAKVIFDTSRQVSTTYGVLTLPSSMHKGQFPGHSYVLIDKDGIVKFVRDDIQMAVRNQELSVEIDKL